MTEFITSDQHFWHVNIIDFCYRPYVSVDKMRLLNLLMDVANRYEYEIIQMEAMPDHIHIFVGAKPTVAPIDIVRVFKSITAIELFKKYPKLKSFYGRCDSLWSVGKFISTIGNVSAETIKKYIADQKGT